MYPNVSVVEVSRTYENLAFISSTSGTTSRMTTTTPSSSQHQKTSMDTNLQLLNRQDSNTGTMFSDTSLNHPPHPPTTEPNNPLFNQSLNHSSSGPGSMFPEEVGQHLARLVPEQTPTDGILFDDAVYSEVCLVFFLVYFSFFKVWNSSLAGTLFNTLNKFAITFWGGGDKM